MEVCVQPRSHTFPSAGTTFSCLYDVAAEAPAPKAVRRGILIQNRRNDTQHVCALVETIDAIKRVIEAGALQEQLTDSDPPQPACMKLRLNRQHQRQL